MSRTSLSYLSDALIGQTNSYTYRVQALESDRFESDVIKLLERDFNIDSQSVEIHNYASQSASYRTIYALIVFFSTIIVALVILVALSNVFVVVDYNIAVRKKEFAILRSIGMEPKGLERMLTFDSVRYFFLPLLIGIPLGVAPVCAVYLFLRRIFAISFTMPYALILIYVGAFIYMSIFVTMYAICKVKKIKIMETIMRDIND